MKALQHTEVPTSSSTSSKSTKAPGKQPSQPKGVPSPPLTKKSAALATDQAPASSSASASASASALEAAASSDTVMTCPAQESRQASSPSWADIAAQDEEENQKSMDDEEAGVQTGDQQQAWARVLEMTDADLGIDPANIDRSKVFAYHFDISLVNTTPQEIAFDQPAPLPAWLVREEFLNKLNARKFLIVKAPTGSGKSTIFPALAAKVMPKERIMCTQVKRNTTEAVCQSTRKMWRRSPQDMVVGFKHGMSDKQTSATDKTKILFCTEGIAGNEILSLDRSRISDIAIKNCKLLLVDEARSNNVDIELIIASILTRSDSMNNFKLVVVSATLDVSSFIDVHMRQELLEKQLII